MCVCLDDRCLLACIVVNHLLNVIVVEVSSCNRGLSRSRYVEFRCVGRSLVVKLEKENRELRN